MMTEQSDACVRQPPPCVLCSEPSVAHCRVGEIHYARYVSIKTTEDFTMYDHCAVCGDCLGRMKHDAGKSVDLDEHTIKPMLTDNV